MITHAALLLHDVPAGSPELRRGMPVARCGFQNDGHGVAIAWERRFVDCPMCLFEIDNVTVVPGASDMTPTTPIKPPTTELPMRTPKRPDYVPEGHIYVPPEFRDDHDERGLNLFQSIAIWVLVVAAVVTIIALLHRYTDNVGTSHSPAGVVTPHTYPAPGFTTMPAR